MQISKILKFQHCSGTATCAKSQSQSQHQTIATFSDFGIWDHGKKTLIWLSYWLTFHMDMEVKGADFYQEPAVILNINS